MRYEVTYIKQQRSDVLELCGDDLAAVMRQWAELEEGEAVTALIATRAPERTPFDVYLPQNGVLFGVGTTVMMERTSAAIIRFFHIRQRSWGLFGHEELRRALENDPVYRGWLPMVPSSDRSEDLELRPLVGAGLLEASYREPGVGGSRLWYGVTDEFIARLRRHTVRGRIGLQALEVR